MKNIYRYKLKNNYQLKARADNSFQQRLKYYTSVNLLIPDEWARILYDPVLATAILDRFVQHCHFVVIRSKSYRMKQRERTLRVMSESSSE